MTTVPSTSPGPSADDPLDALWSAVAHVARARVATVDAALAATRAGRPGAAALRATAHEECHKLVGSLDSYGRTGGSALALRAADLLTDGTADLDELATVVGALHRVVDP